MEIREEFGLQVATATADEALAAVETNQLPTDASVLRVLDPPPAAWHELAAAGFVRKPIWLTWIAPTPSSDEDYVARLDRKARQDMRRARVRADAAGLRIEVQQPIDADSLESFLSLYENRVEQMEFGFAFALNFREKFLTDDNELAVLAFEGDRIVGGVLCLQTPEEEAVRLRFSAVEPRWRVHSLARLLYWQAFRATRERGFRWVTLGNDPNLYGHVAKPGLLSFKRSLGFRPAPAVSFGKGYAGDAADLVLSLHQLTDPSVILGYGESDRGGQDYPSLDDGFPPFQTYVFSSSESGDTVSHFGAATSYVRLPVLGESLR
jgi:GNAT superfamily N-acetyltransferase